MANNRIILGVGAHMDDLDFSCSGTIAKWVKEGAQAYYLILTDGSRGQEDLNISSQQLTNTRQAEQRAAAGVLGIKDVFFGDFEDGNLVNNDDVRLFIVRFIRQIQPTTVITWDPTFVYDEKTGSINHPDHRNCGQATLDAVYPYARNSRSYPELLDEGLEIHKVRELLLRNSTKANFYVDITDTFETKLQALRCHISQFEDIESSLARVGARAKETGQEAGFEYAEGFVRIEITS